MPIGIVLRAAGALVAAAVSVGFAQAQSVPPAVLQYATESLPKSWAPYAPISNEWAHLVYDTLVQRDPDGHGTISPMLATHWEQNKTSLTLHLRPGVTFHDGSPFNAQAVKVNFDLNLKEGGYASGNLKAIREIEVVNDLTVRFHLSSPNPFLLHALSGSAVAIGEPRTLVDGSINRVPIGTGPMRYSREKTIPGGKVVFEAFPQYWNLAETKFGRIEITPVGEGGTRALAVKTGRFDMVRLELNALGLAKTMPEMKVASYAAYHFMLIFFDRANMFRDVRVRQAMCHALNTKDNAHMIGAGDSVATGQRFGKGQYGHAGDAVELSYNPEKAKRLMAEAGNPDISVTLPTTQSNVALAQAMAQQLGVVGIKVKVQPMPLAQYLSEWRSGKYPLGIGLLATGDNPYSFYQTALATDAPFNYTQTATPEIDASVAKALAIDDMTAAETEWSKVSKLTAELAITCSDFDHAQYLLYNPARVQNVRGFNGFSSTPLWRAVTPVAP